VLARAQAAGTLAGSRAKPIWITKLGWTTRPVDGRGLSHAEQARRLLAALYRLRKRAVPVIWSGLRDTERGRPPDFPPVASGLWARRHYRDLRGDRRKPAARAFRLPFVVTAGSGRARAWGIAPPGASRVRVQRRGGGRWRTVAEVRARPGERFGTRLSKRRGVYRARAAGAISLSASAR
jgi:hypothetical protein